MSVIQSKTTGDESVTIALADLGIDVPPSLTVDVTVRTVGVGHQVLEVQRREDVWILEGAPFAELTGVGGRDELPRHVPDWLEPVAELFGVSEVQLGR